MDLVRAYNRALAVRAKRMLAQASLLQREVQDVVFELLVEYGDRTLETAFRAGSPGDREVVETGILALTAFLERFALAPAPRGSVAAPPQPRPEES